MGTQAGVGTSHHRNPAVAGREAAESALQAAGIDEPDFAFMFATVGYNQESILKSVRDVIGSTPLVGCSGEGIITREEVDESNFSVAVMVIKSDQMRFYHGLSTGLKADSAAVGRAIARDVQDRVAPDSLALFLFPDGINLNFDALQIGLEGALSLERKLPLVGGAAGDNWEFTRTYQYCDDQVVSDGVAWALLSGDVQAAWGISHGCVPVGVEYKVTRSEGNTIYEIDHRPVLDVLREDYLTEEDIKDWVKTLQTFTLGLKTPEQTPGYDQYVIRTMVGGIDEETGSTTLATEVAEGMSLWVTRRDYEKLCDGIDQTTDEIKGQLGGHSPELVFQFECIGRGKVYLLERQKKGLLVRLRQEIEQDVPWIGFYTYGEIGPVGGQNHFHNETMVFLVVY